MPTMPAYNPQDLSSKDVTTSFAFLDDSGGKTVFPVNTSRHPAVFSIVGVVSCTGAHLGLLGTFVPNSPYSTPLHKADYKFRVGPPVDDTNLCDSWAAAMSNAKKLERQVTDKGKGTPPGTKGGRARENAKVSSIVDDGAKDMRFAQRCILSNRQTILKLDAGNLGKVCEFYGFQTESAEDFKAFKEGLQTFAANPLDIRIDGVDVHVAPCYTSEMMLSCLVRVDFVYRCWWITADHKWTFRAEVQRITLLPSAGYDPLIQYLELTNHAPPVCPFRPLAQPTNVASIAPCGASNPPLVNTVGSPDGTRDSLIIPGGSSVVEMVDGMTESTSSVSPHGAVNNASPMLAAEGVDDQSSTASESGIPLGCEENGEPGKNPLASEKGEIVKPTESIDTSDEVLAAQGTTENIEVSDKKTATSAQLSDCLKGEIIRKGAANQRKRKKTDTVLERPVRPRKKSQVGVSNEPGPGEIGENLEDMQV